MRVLFFIALVFACSIVNAQSANFVQVEQKVKNIISNAQWDELLVVAPELVIEEPSKADGYYYTSYAFYKLNSFDKAAEYLKLAEKYADESWKEKIGRLKTDIESGARVDQAEKSIEKKKDDSRSAQDYKKLWEMDKSNIEHALNAVEKFIEKEDYPSALEILNDPAMQQEAGAKALVGKIQKTPAMIKLNGYNKAFKEGQDLYNRENYADAVTKFNQALSFMPGDRAASVNKSKAVQRNAWKTARSTHTIESYKTYLRQYPSDEYSTDAHDILQRSYLSLAREGASKGSFDDAERYYKQYQSEYPAGPQIKDADRELLDLYVNEAKKQEQLKEAYNISRAIDMYALASNLNPASVSSEHVEKLKKKYKRWSRPDTYFFGWSADEKNMLGFMSGGLKNRKPGMYFAARTNGDISKSSDVSWKTDDKNSNSGAPLPTWKFNNTIINPAVHVTIGITQKIAYPLWAYAGAGVTYYTDLREFKNSSNGATSLVENPDRKFTALNIEGGLLLKAGFLILRYGINKPMNDRFPQAIVQHFGVGFDF
ncbi:tetratricopeptide repeat protein [Sediminibacterium soli]|uniref:tetratricopeptide repeat protein n=1 Tax=Sediminibacterium soli TaxID=2698829 RepID=UPI00137A8EAB|nr:hypothetical protein [Sediminibacterium soli]NCI45807.1 hypothetical protein [Sediminibacterium soli]